MEKNETIVQISIDGETPQQIKITEYDEMLLVLKLFAERHKITLSEAISIHEMVLNRKLLKLRDVYFGRMLDLLESNQLTVTTMPPNKFELERKQQQDFWTEQERIQNEKGYTLFNKEGYKQVKYEE